MLSAMTRNLGFRASGSAWLRGLLAGGDAPDVALVQDVHPDLLDAPPRGYVLTAGRSEAGCPSACTSAVLVRAAVGEQCGPEDDRAFAAMGSYVAVARLVRDGRPVLLVSAHASPTKVPRYKLREEYGTRSCESGPWWSDAFLAELRGFGTRTAGDAVVAGDLNVSHGCDFQHPGHTCGAEFFRSVAGCAFVDTTMRDWRSVERPTRADPDHQHARVLASRSFARFVHVPDAAPVHDDASEHAAIWFRLRI